MRSAQDRPPFGIAGEQGQQLKAALQRKLIEHQQYIVQFGEDMPEIRNWQWDPAQWSNRST